MPAKFSTNSDPTETICVFLQSREDRLWGEGMVRMDFFSARISATPSFVSGPYSNKISTMILLTLVLFALIKNRW